MYASRLPGRSTVVRIVVVVTQLNFLLTGLSIERAHLRFRCIKGRPRLVEFLPTHYTGTGEATHAVKILLRPFELGDLGGSGTLLAFQSGLLFLGVDLHHGSAGGNPFAGMHEYPRDNAFDLRHD